MPRAKRGFKARRRRKKVLKQARGFRGGRSKLFRTKIDASKSAIFDLYGLCALMQQFVKRV